MKNVSHIPRKELDLFSEKDLEFIFNQEKLTEFIGLPFNLENFNAQIKAIRLQLRWVREKKRDN